MAHLLSQLKHLPEFGVGEPERRVQAVRRLSRLPFEYVGVVGVVGIINIGNTFSSV